MDKKAEIDYSKLVKYILGSLAVGGAAAAGTNLVKQLRWLQDRNNKFKDTSGDDNTIYIDLPVLKSPSKVKQAASSDTVSAALISSVLASILGWKGVNSLYAKQRNKQLQKELDAAQIAHINTLLENPTKKANVVSNVIGSAKGGAILAMLAAAVLTNQLLKANFKEKKTSNPNSLSRVRFRAKPMEKELPVGNMTGLKEASLSEDGLEVYIRTGLIYGAKKASDLKNIVNAVVFEGVDAVCEDFKKIGSYDATMNKFDVDYSKCTTSKLEKYAAIVEIVKNAFLGEIAMNAAAYEHANATTNSFLKLAMQIEDPELEHHLISIYDSYASLVKCASMKPFINSLVKQGFIDPALLLPIGNMLKNEGNKDKVIDDQANKEEPAENILYDTTVSPSDTENTIDSAELLEDNDLIDQFISDNKKTILDIIQTHKSKLQS